MDKFHTISQTTAWLVRNLSEMGEDTSHIRLKNDKKDNSDQKINDFSIPQKTTPGTENIGPWVAKGRFFIPVLQRFCNLFPKH